MSLIEGREEFVQSLVDEGRLLDREASAQANDGTVLGMDSLSELTRVQVGSGELKVPAANVEIGAKLRVQLLARDLIVSTQPPQYLSVRNSLAGVVTTVTNDDANSDLIGIDIGGTQIMARVTAAATRELAIRPGLPVWALVKAASLRARPISTASPDAE